MLAVPLLRALPGASGFAVAAFVDDADWGLAPFDAGAEICGAAAPAGSAVTDTFAAAIWLPVPVFGNVDAEGVLFCTEGGAGTGLPPAWVCAWLATTGRIALGEVPECVGSRA